MRKAILLAAVAEQRETLLTAVSSLPDEAWATRCPNPAPPQGVTRLEEPVRTVRDLVAHICVVDGIALDAGVTRPWSALRRLEMPRGWDRRRLTPFLELPPQDLADVLARSGERFERMVAAAPTALGRVPMAGPFGRQSLSQLVAQRVLHEWLHERDIIDGLAGGAVGHVAPPPAAVAAAMVDAVLTSLPAEVLPRTDADHGVVRLIIDIGNQADAVQVGPQRMWAADFTRRQYGPRVVATPDTVVQIDAATLALLANGRADRLGAEPALHIEGSEALGRALLAAIRCPDKDLACVEPADQESDQVIDLGESAAQSASLY